MKKFDTLIEGVTNRFTAGGFLTGDLVKIKSDALNHEWAKRQGGNTLEKLKEFTVGDLNIRISSVKALRPAVGGGTQADQQVDDYYCDIVREHAQGLYFDVLTVPAELLEYIEQDINLAEVPDSLKRDNNDIQKPEEVKVEDSEDPMNPVKQTGVEEGDKKLPTQDTKMDSADEPTDNFTTRVYMQGM